MSKMIKSYTICTVYFKCFNTFYLCLVKANEYTLIANTIHIDCITTNSLFI